MCCSRLISLWNPLRTGHTSKSSLSASYSWLEFMLDPVINRLLHQTSNTAQCHSQPLKLFILGMWCQLPRIPDDFLIILKYGWRSKSSQSAFCTTVRNLAVIFDQELSGSEGLSCGFLAVLFVRFGRCVWPISHLSQPSETAHLIHIIRAISYPVRPWLSLPHVARWFPVPPRVHRRGFFTSVSRRFFASLPVVSWLPSAWRTGGFSFISQTPAVH